MICDLAETYHIYDYESLPVDLIATLVVGLRENSRVIMKITKRKLTFDQAINTMMLDGINWLKWSKTKDAQKGIGTPKSIYKQLCEIEEVSESEVVTFNSGADFMKYRNYLIGR